VETQFTDASTGNPASWLWDFGDGNTSTEPSPTHTYAAAGTYTVTLTASSDCGASSAQQTVSVADAVPVSAFAHDAPQCLGQAVSFTDASTGLATAWFWDFGDGYSSTEQNPAHTYAAEGTYTVTLVASNGCGMGFAYTQDVSTQSDVIPPPVGNSFQVHFSGASDLLFTWDNLSGAWGDYEVVRYDGWPAPPTEAAMDASPVAGTSPDGASGVIEANGQQNPPATIFYKVRATSACTGAPGPTGP
jgi:PKD repeat protein